MTVIDSFCSVIVQVNLQTACFRCWWGKRVARPTLAGFPSHAGRNYRTGKRTAVSDLRAEQQLVSPTCQASIVTLQETLKYLPNISDDPWTTSHRLLKEKLIWSKESSILVLLFCINQFSFFQHPQNIFHFIFQVKKTQESVLSKTDYICSEAL